MTSLFLIQVQFLFILQKKPVSFLALFQMSGLGSMMGQANVFFRYYPEKIDLNLS